MGDIVWVKEFNDIRKERIDNHLFVIIDDDGKAVPAEYFGFVVSSNLLSFGNIVYFLPYTKLTFKIIIS